MFTAMIQSKTIVKVKTQSDNKDVVLSLVECLLAFCWWQSFVFFLYCLIPLQKLQPTNGFP